MKRSKNKIKMAKGLRRYETSDWFINKVCKEHFINMARIKRKHPLEHLKMQWIRYICLASERSIFATTLYQITEVEFDKDVFAPKGTNGNYEGNFKDNYLIYENGEVLQVVEKGILYPPVVKTYYEHINEGEVTNIGKVHANDLIDAVNKNLPDEETLTKLRLKYHFTIAGKRAVDVSIVESEIWLVMLKSQVYIKDIDAICNVNTLIATEPSQ